MTSSTGTQAYGEPSYWDQRYREDPSPFDWYQEYKTLAPLFDVYIRRSHHLLVVGCGNSKLGEELVSDGYLDVINIDISSVVVEAMQKKHEDKPEMNYIKMDVRDMSAFESCSFDAVIDKGTLDSLMCGQNAHHNTLKMLEEVGRILKDNGVFILVTYGEPSYRLHLLNELQLWTINLHVIGSCKDRNLQECNPATSKFNFREGCIDVGCVTDSLSIFCALVGARRVYAIEASDITVQASEVVKTNNLSDKVLVIHEKVEKVSIQEKVDVIIFEWMG